MNFISHLFSLFHDGGPVMYVMAICSFAAIAIAVQKIIFLRTVCKDTLEFQNGFTALLNKRDFASATSFCNKFSHNIYSHIVLSGLDALSHKNEVEPALEAAATVAAARLRDHLDELSMLVTLAPLLGLLGTIIGMIQTFNVFDLQSGQPTAITGGIGEALIATATGLCVATLALLLHSFLTRKVNRLIVKIEQVSSQVLSVTSSKDF